jgi:hypothetical protein
MTDRAALLDCADEVLDGEVALGARGPRTAAVLARLAFEDWLNEVSTWLSTSQGRPTTNSKLVVLSAFRGVEVGEHAKRVWHALSRACHHHACELQPSAAEGQAPGGGSAPAGYVVVPTRLID